MRRGATTTSAGGRRGLTTWLGLFLAAVVGIAIAALALTTGPAEAGDVGKARPVSTESTTSVQKRAAGVTGGRSIVLTFRLGPWADGGEVTALLAAR